MHNYRCEQLVAAMALCAAAIVSVPVFAESRLDMSDVQAPITWIDEQEIEEKTREPNVSGGEPNGAQAPVVTQPSIRRTLTPGLVTVQWLRGDTLATCSGILTELARAGQRLVVTSNACVLPMGSAADRLWVAVSTIGQMPDRPLTVSGVIVPRDARSRLPQATGPAFLVVEGAEDLDSGAEIAPMPSWSKGPRVLESRFFPQGNLTQLAGALSVQAQYWPAYSGSACRAGGALPGETGSPAFVVDVSSDTQQAGSSEQAYVGVISYEASSGKTCVRPLTPTMLQALADLGFRDASVEADDSPIEGLAGAAARTHSMPATAAAGGLAGKIIKRVVDKVKEWIAKLPKKLPKKPRWSDIKKTLLRLTLQEVVRQATWEAIDSFAPRAIALGFWEANERELLKSGYSREEVLSSSERLWACTKSELVSLRLKFGECY